MNATHYTTSGVITLTCCCCAAQVSCKAHFIQITLFTSLAKPDNFQMSKISFQDVVFMMMIEMSKNKFFIVVGIRTQQDLT